VVALTVTFTDVPLNTVCKGKLCGGLVAVARPVPNIVKIDPCAIPEFGMPGRIKLKTF
jgi:hypothetical protein